MYDTVNVSVVINRHIPLNGALYLQNEWWPENFYHPRNLGSETTVKKDNRLRKKGTYKFADDNKIPDISWSLNPLHNNNVHILHTVHHKFRMVLTRKISLSVRSSLS